jgi:hypothetical protein
MCKKYESQLKEALEELSSLQLVNKLLQKELLSHMTTWESNLNPNMNQGIPIGNANSKWSLVTAKTRKERLNENGVCEILKSCYRDNHLIQLR